LSKDNFSPIFFVSSFLASTLVLLIALGILSGCTTFTTAPLKDPKVKVLDVKVSAISLTDVSIDVVMNIKNPNPKALTLDSLTYQLNISGETATEGTFSNGMHVPAWGEKNITFPLKFKFKSVGSILMGMINRTLTKEYELKGHAQFGIFTIPFLQKGDVNLN